MSKSGEEMKKKQEGLSSLVAQVSHLGLFLEQNSAVMKEAKRKSKEMNREEKENILSLNKKERYFKGKPLRSNISRTIICHASYEVFRILKYLK